MNTLKIDIVRLSEVRWPNNGKCAIDKSILYYFGNTSGKLPH